MKQPYHSQAKLVYIIYTINQEISDFRVRPAERFPAGRHEKQPLLIFFVSASLQSPETANTKLWKYMYYSCLRFRSQKTCLHEKSEFRPFFVSFPQQPEKPPAQKERPAGRSLQIRIKLCFIPRHPHQPRRVPVSWVRHLR